MTPTEEHPEACMWCGYMPEDGWYQGDYESHLINSPQCWKNENAMARFANVWKDPE